MTLASYSAKILSVNEKLGPTEKDVTQRIKRAIAENPAMDPAGAAAAEVRNGILSPLIEFRDALGLNSEEIAVILRYADFASREAQRRVEEEHT